jgi:hypothetical protein
VPMAAVVVAAARRQRWRQCGGGDDNAVTVFLLQGEIENSSGNGKIVHRIVPQIVLKPRRKIVFF